MGIEGVNIFGYIACMKKSQDLTEIVKETAETVVDYITKQAKQVAKMVGKKPKARALSWDKIMDDCFPARPHGGQAKAAPNAKLPEANQQLSLIPPEIFEELHSRIEANKMDEVLCIRLYESLHDCEVRIIRSHVHLYECTTKKGSETIDFSLLRARLLNKFAEHRQFVQRQSQPSLV
jgi:hypothetical protein